MRVLLKQERTFLPNFNRTNVFKLLEILFTSTEQFNRLSFLEVMAGGLSLLY